MPKVGEEILTEFPTDLPFDDEVENTTAPDVEPFEGNRKGELTCQSCGKQFLHTNRGRKPKKCLECRGNPEPSSPRNTTSGGTKKVDGLVSQIETFYLTLGWAGTMVPNGDVHLDAMIVSSNAGAMAESWRPLLENDSKIRAFWSKILNGSGWGQVIMAHGMVANAIVQNHRKPKDKNNE